MEHKLGAVVIYSGGMDSFTTLHAAMARHGYNLVAFSLYYGQRHKKELDYAAKVCANLGVEHIEFNAEALRGLLNASSLTSDQKVPEGHYADESMKQTVVPNRNMILLALASGLAVARGAEEVWTGMHSGDHAIYPDCRPEFVTAMNGALQIANYTPVRIEAPFLSTDKGGILKWGLARRLDYSKTWTCYNGRQHACGKCGACQERLEAFKVNGVEDPLQYEEVGALATENGRAIGARLVGN